MRQSVLVLIFPLVLGGCLDFSNQQEGPPGPWPDHCWTNAYLSDGDLAGAWEDATDPNATREGFFSEYQPRGGIPIGPQSRSVLGTSGNISKASWRVDGEPMGETGEGEAEGEGHGEREQSPETLWIEFRGALEETTPEFSGHFESHEGPQRIEDAALEFLDAVRGPQADNELFAEEFAHGFALGMPEPQPVSMDQESEPARVWPPRVALPMGPWATGEQLETVVYNATLEDRYRPWLTHSAWRWEVSIPAASTSLLESRERWVVRVDARDNVDINVLAADPMDWNAFTVNATAVFKRLGLPEPDWGDWDHRQGHGRAYCPDE